MSIVPIEAIQSRILLIRNQKIMLDADLAKLYGTTTKRLNQQVKRNLKRFPAGFVFQLTEKEKREVVTICDHLKDLKFSPALPLAFTEHGALMVATVLNTPIAVKTSIFIIQAFVQLRERAAAHKDLLRKMEILESIVGNHDEKIRALFHTMRSLMSGSKKPLKQIGFRP
jgi:hypothetical protein